MTKTLISFLGTGVPEKNRKYREARYSFNGEEIGKGSFVSSILSDYLNADRLILIGTVKSMWEGVYEYYCERKGLPLNYDYWSRLGDLAENSNHDTSIEDFVDFSPILEAMGPGSEIRLIPYGLNSDELWDIFTILKEVFEGIDSKEEIYLDITHSFRSLPLFSLTAFMYLKDTIGRDVNIKGIYYGMLETRREFDGVAPIVDLSIIYEIQNWIKAAYSFQNYGKGYLAARLLNDKNTADTLNQFSDALGANHMREISTQINKFRALATKIDEPIAKMFLPKVLLDFTDRLLKTKSDAEFQLELSIWHWEKRNYSSAYIVFVESLVTYVCESKGLQPWNKEDRETAKSKLEKRDLYGDLAVIFRRNRKIRNDLAHSRIVKKGSKTRIDVTPLKADQDYFKKYLKNK